LLVDDAVAVVVDQVARLRVAGKTRAPAVVAVVAATHRGRTAIAISVEHGETAGRGDPVADHLALAGVVTPQVDTLLRGRASGKGRAALGEMAERSRRAHRRVDEVQTSAVTADVDRASESVLAPGRTDG
jgi:hypothetical protein